MTPADLGIKLEYLIRNYIKSDKGDFGIKSNDTLTMHDWRSSVYFALGHKYGKSNNDPKVKETIENFRQIFFGNSIVDAINEFKSNNLNATDEDACKRIEYIINELEKILN